MSDLEKQQKVDEAFKLSDFFQIEVTLSIFGKTLIHWIYPPLKH